MKPGFTMLVLCLLAICGCASASKTAGAADATFVVVRHAEKSQDDPRDPSLNEAGRARAVALADALRDMPLTAVYATTYKRARQTAMPTAAAHGLAVTTYDASQAAADFAASLRREHRSGAVLIVGHSNTVPQIVAALCACKIAALGDNDYGNLYLVRIDAAGKATLQQRTY